MVGEGRGMCFGFGSQSLPIWLLLVRTGRGRDHRAGVTENSGSFAARWNTTVCFSN